MSKISRVLCLLYQYIFKPKLKWKNLSVCLKIMHFEKKIQNIRSFWYDIVPLKQKLQNP